MAEEASTEEVSSGGDGSSSIELSSTSNVEDGADIADSFVSNVNPSTNTLRQRNIPSSTTTSTTSTWDKWDQKTHLEALLNKDAGPMRTVSYELYDSAFWNARKLSIQNSTTTTNNNGGGAMEHEKKCKFLLRSSIFGVGFVTASVGYFVAWSSEHLAASYKQYLGPDGVNSDMTSKVYGRYLGWSLLFAILSFLPVAFVRPVASGSGIAEAKAVLNGIKIPACTELLSAACKAISVIFSVASALPVGLEGPLIFIG